MRQPGLRGSPPGRNGRRICGLLGAIAAIATLIAIFKSLTAFRSSVAAAAQQQHGGGLPVAPASLLVSLAADAQRQLAAVDWTACLRPRAEAEAPMTKDQFLQQQPAR